jgi:hypothetical protein
MGRLRPLLDAVVPAPRAQPHPRVRQRLRSPLTGRLRSHRCEPNSLQPPPLHETSRLLSGLEAEHLVGRAVALGTLSLLLPCCMVSTRSSR